MRDEGVEVEVQSLELDEEFVQDQGYAPWGIPKKYVWGRLVDRGVGSVLVEIVEDGKLQRVRWAPEAPVIPNREIKIESEDIQQMPTPNPVAVNLITRYKFQLKQLIEGDAEKQETARQRLPTFIKEAAGKGVVLPHPIELGYNFDGSDMDLFDSLLGGASDANVGNGVQSSDTKEDNMAVAVTPTATETKAQKQERLNAERKARLAEAKEAKATAKAAAPKREKKVIEPHACLDGCGEMLTTNGKFRPGHDAKLKSLIQKIERGEVAIDELPEVAAAVTKFKKGDLLKKETKEGDKVVITKVQTYICTESPVKLPAKA